MLVDGRREREVKDAGERMLGTREGGGWHDMYVWRETLSTLQLLVVVFLSVHIYQLASSLGTADE